MDQFRNWGVTVKLLLTVSLILLTQSCGKGLQDPAKIVRELSGLIASGAELKLDAKDIVGACPGSLNWPDTSGNGNDGTLVCTGGGSIAASPARVNFDGSTTHVTTTIDGNSADMPSATWIVWVRPTSANFAHILSIDDNAGAWNRALTIDNATTNVYGAFNRLNSNNWEATSASLNTWTFLVVEFTAGNIVIQKNGTRFSFGSAPGYNNTSLDFTIGSSADRTNDFLNGDIGWVAIYPRILTATEIKQTCLALVDRFSGASGN